MTSMNSSRPTSYTRNTSYALGYIAPRPAKKASSQKPLRCTASLNRSSALS